MKWFGCRAGGRGDVICILKVFFSRPSVFGGLLIAKRLKNKTAPAWLCYSCYQRLHRLTYQTNIKLRSFLKVCLPRCFLRLQVALPAALPFMFDSREPHILCPSRPPSDLPFPLSLSLSRSSVFDEKESLSQSLNVHLEVKVYKNEKWFPCWTCLVPMPFDVTHPV